MTRVEMLVNRELELTEQEATAPTEGAMAWRHFVLGPVRWQLSPTATLLAKAEPSSNPVCHTFRPL